MKRGAERQISKDDGDDIEEVEDPGKGLQKADESVLAKRQIRGLPKRTMASNKALSFAGLPSAPLSPADSEPPASPKFGGFSGFGSGAGPSPFSFAPPAVTTFTTSNVAPSASAATKGFASVIQAASTANASPTIVNASPSTSNEDYNAELNYYKSIRGLNASFLTAIQKAVDQDPFIDIAGLLESYKNLRTTVQTDHDNSSKATSQKAPASGPPVPEKAAPSTTGFPVPKGFSGFGSFGSPSLHTSSTNGTDQSSAPKSAFPFSTSSSSTNATPTFSLGAKMSEDTPTAPSPFGTSEAPKSAFSFGTKSDDPSSSSPSPFSFAPPAAPAPSKDKDDSKSSSSAFGSGVPNFFASSKAASSTFSDLKPTSAFNTTTSLFGNSTDSKTPSFFTPGSSDLFNKVSAKTDTGNEEIKTGSTTGLFGSSSFTPPTNAFASAATDKPTSAFGTFGGGSPPKGNGFTFGKAGGGSIGNPVGFGFGVAKLADGASTSSSSAPTEFSFGAPPTKSVSPSMDTASRSGSQPVAGDEGTQDDAKLLPTSNHDDEGEGEEDEETTYTVKAKVFKLSKTPDKSEWKDLGCMFRLKKHKETGARRALMRNSATGRIIINFRLFVSLTPTLMKTMISFVGHDEGAPASFRIRVKTPEQAQELKNALDREVAAVKESS
ncbi:uncharacterized protein BJ212DRAFT_1484421 [Suillus subaureus]|uniref:RanBD1 domain-containing protein n=1 Tax=Suillus subaureus TaxID=48587 RepID=A0A9P7E242_9AGAM|nr:uncharacterized protein BJ212DRAFT_1484421 [Suillus subaureus]KAG1809298.1 hypothetical protein BJ212DRAFT_1484421 [Suillus subaureus]